MTNATRTSTHFDADSLLISSGSNDVANDRKWIDVDGRQDCGMVVYATDRSSHAFMFLSRDDARALALAILDELAAS